MRIVASSRSLLRREGPFAIGIGVFDGVHRGHQELLQRVRDLACTEAVESLVYTFHPHPARVLNPARAPSLLEPIEDRLGHFAALGMDATLVERFDAAFAATEAERFVDEVLLGCLQARHVVVGEGFRFGLGGRGDVELLRARAGQQGCQVHAVAPVALEGERISSSRIRDRVRAGDVATAKRLLGRPFSLSGLVMRGARRGSTLGFGTANVQPENETLPAPGVYAAQANGPMGPHRAVVNVGFNPTFGSDVLKVEAHLLDYPGGELYGVTLVLHLVERLRDEQRFSGPEALKAQISRDIDNARRILGRGAASPRAREQLSGVQ